MPRHRRGWAMDSGTESGERHSSLLVSMVEPALLILISEQPRHGYTLLSDLAALGISTLHPSVVYRTLREMEALEWIESDWDVQQREGPPRRMYRLTARGGEVLQSWRAELQRAQDILTDLKNRIKTETKML